MFSKRKKVGEIRDLFELIMMPQKKELDSKWVETNFHLIKDIFTNKLEVSVAEHSDKSHHYHEGIIDDMMLDSERLRIESKKFGVVEFHNPSHYLLEIGERGSAYSLTITSGKNAPSQLKLFYEDI